MEKLTKREQKVVTDVLVKAGYLHRKIEDAHADIWKSIIKLRRLVHAEGCNAPTDCPNHHKECHKGLSTVTATLWEVASACASYSLSATDIETNLREPNIGMTMRSNKSFRNRQIENFIDRYNKTWKPNFSAALQILWLVRSILSLQYNTLTSKKRMNPADARDYMRITESIEILNAMRGCFQAVAMYGREMREALSHLMRESK